MKISGRDLHRRGAHGAPPSAVIHESRLEAPLIMEILTNHPLKAYTTFKIGGPARYFASLALAEDISQAIAFAASHGVPIFALGGGSNLLVSDSGIAALVVHPVCTGIDETRDHDGETLVHVNAAELWDRLVAHAVGRGLWGIENLSHIPGQAGAALVQNIGAYGQQLSDVLERAEVASLADGSRCVFTRDECGFGYRRSIFNTTQKGQFLILSLTLRLARAPHRNLSYPDVAAWFEERGIREPQLDEIRRAIVAIRNRKFPYPREEKGGNAGSFFKNLTLAEDEYAALEKRVENQFGTAARERLGELRNRSRARAGVRIPTAFLMELCGLKGFRIGGALVNETQPLVLLNQGGATAQDVLSLARHIRQTLFRKTGVRVEIEPELAGFSPHELGRYLSFE